MAELVYGIVNKISGKPTRNGGTIYNLCVETDGQEDWYGFGFDKPDFYEGAEIEFEVTYNGKFANVAEGTVEVISPGEPPRSRGGSRSQGGGRQGGSGGRASGGRDRAPSGRSGGRGGAASRAPSKPAAKADVDWDRKDRLIRAQSCQNTAIATVSMLLTAGAVSLPKKTADQYDAVIALVEHEAARLFKKYDEVADGKHSVDGVPADGAEEGYDEDYPE